MSIHRGFAARFSDAIVSQAAPFAVRGARIRYGIRCTCVQGDSGGEARRREKHSL